MSNYMGIACISHVLRRLARVEGHMFGVSHGVGFVLESTSIQLKPYWIWLQYKGYKVDMLLHNLLHVSEYNGFNTIRGNKNDFWTCMQVYCLNCKHVQPSKQSRLPCRLCLSKSYTFFFGYYTKAPIIIELCKWKSKHDLEKKRIAMLFT